MNKKDKKYKLLLRWKYNNILTNIILMHSFFLKPVTYNLRYN